MLCQAVFLTGRPGVGKTSLLKKIIGSLTLEGFDIHGFYTEEVRTAEGRVGFDAVPVTGGSARTPLARVRSAAQGPTVGKYTVDVPTFEAFALLEIGRATECTTEQRRLLVVDEVGRMELFSRKFFPAVLRAFDMPQVVLFGTVPVPKAGKDLREVAELKQRSDVTLVEVTVSNRDQLAPELLKMLRELLGNSEDRKSAEAK